MFRILVSGQSNSIGKGLGGPAWPRPPRLKAWNNDNDRRHYPGWSDGSDWVAPTIGLRPFRTGNGARFQNFGLWFAAAYLDDHDEDVRLVLASKGATSIKEWVSGRRPMLDRVVDVWDATGFGGAADVFLWHQGEADHRKMTDAAYAERLVTLVGELRDAEVIKQTAVTVIGGLARTSLDRIAWNKGLAAFAAATPGFAFVDTRGLSNEEGSTSHFDGPSLKKLGGRYYDAWRAAA